MRPRQLQLAALPALLLITGCGLVDPPQNPDERLPVRNLSPASLVATVRSAALPDSGGAGTLGRLRFTLAAEAVQALSLGGVLEAVLRVAPGTATLEGWSENAGAWRSLDGGVVNGTGGNDRWWLGGWSDPALGVDLVAADGTVRLRSNPGAEGARSFLRVVEPAAGLWFRRASAGALCAWSDRLILMADGVVHELDTNGTEISQFPTGNAPVGICRVGDHFYGVTPTEIRRVPVTGGTWQRVASLPWGSHGGVALTSDLTDLFLVRYPRVKADGNFPALFRLSTGRLVDTANFFAAVEDSSTLRRNGMPGGNGSGLGWWGKERMLVAPGTQEGAFGLLAFSKAGRFLRFIPLPFEPEGVQFAFVGTRLFVGSASPSLEALQWSQSPQPEPPAPAFLYRWSAP